MPASCPPSSHFDLTFSNMNHPVLVTGQGSDSLEAGAVIEAEAVIEAGAISSLIDPSRNDGAFQAQIQDSLGPLFDFDSFDPSFDFDSNGAFQAQSNQFQDLLSPLVNFDSYGYHSELSGISPSQPSIPVLGEPSSARTSAQPRVAIKMVSPEALDERPIKHRRDVQLKLEISVSAEPLPDGVVSPEYCIRVPKTKSVKRSGSHLERTVLDLRLEVLGATTGSPLMSACYKCSVRESPSSSRLSMIDFSSKEDLISVKEGKASIAFRFLCLPGHHGTMDEEYKLIAKILEGDQVLEQHTFPNWIRVISNSHKKRNAAPATIQQGIETSTVMDPPFNSTDQGDISNSRTLGASTSGTSAGEDRRSGRVQSLPSPAQSPTVDVSASVPPANKESEPAGQQGSLQTSAAPVNEHAAESCPVLSRVNPRRGPTSGGDEIDLIVSNLPPTMKLFARFGSNITATAHIAPGVLFCLLPPAAHPGVVSVTLCQAPSTSAEPYGSSLASFEYEADSARAVSLLFKLLNGKLLLGYMPLIQRLLQRDAGSPSLEVEPGPLNSNMSLRSSLPESAFLDILSALNPLPEFPRLLATVNEQGQTLLHLAIHLRYRELFQKLIHWGIDLNARDVNGFTALHVGYLCDDAFVIGFLEAKGATPFVLDELGRSPTELAASISTPNRIISGEDEEMVPLAVGYTNQSKQQRRLLGRAIQVETQEIAFWPAVGEGHPSDTPPTVDSGDLFHGHNPAATTPAAPEAINGQSIRVHPGHAQPLHKQPSEALKPHWSWETKPMERDASFSHHFHRISSPPARYGSLSNTPLPSHTPLATSSPPKPSEPMAELFANLQSTSSTSGSPSDILLSASPHYACASTAVEGNTDWLGWQGIKFDAAGTSDIAEESASYDEHDVTSQPTRGRSDAQARSPQHGSHSARCLRTWKAPPPSHDEPMSHEGSISHEEFTEDGPSSSAAAIGTEARSVHPSSLQEGSPLLWPPGCSEMPPTNIAESPVAPTSAETVDEIMANQTDYESAVEPVASSHDVGGINRNTGNLVNGGDSSQGEFTFDLVNRILTAPPTPASHRTCSAKPFRVLPPVPSAKLEVTLKVQASPTPSPNITRFRLPPSSPSRSTQPKTTMGIVRDASMIKREPMDQTSTMIKREPTDQTSTMIKREPTDQTSTMIKLEPTDQTLIAEGSWTPVPCKKQALLDTSIPGREWPSSLLLAKSSLTYPDKRSQNAAGDPSYHYSHLLEGNIPTQPHIVFGAPATSWEKTKATLIAMGVPHNELERWHSSYLWEGIRQELKNGWDPKEKIEEHLTPFFEYLGDRRFRCIAPVRQGEVCGWEGVKKDRAISHICGHFNYNIYVCGGQCHRVECKQRFAEKRNLDQHLKSDSVQCPNCNKTIERKRNLKRHMNNCG